MSRLQIVLIAALHLAPTAAEAQRLIAPGDTVRVMVAGDNRFIDGSVTALPEGGIVLRRHDGSDAFYRTDAVLAIRVRHGTRPATGRGALLGALAGVGVGVWVGVAMMQDGFINAGGEAIALAVPVFAGIGALVGVLVGSFVQLPDNYVRAAIPVPPVPAAPQGDGGSRLMVGMGAESTVLVGVRLRQ